VHRQGIESCVKFALRKDSVCIFMYKMRKIEQRKKEGKEREKKGKWESWRR
jgi:hypothetical protein